MDEFLMYTYKVKRCPRTRAHDWTECPYAHRGEKARRRDPRKFPYQGVVCPEFKNGECKKGQNCECAHGIFEFWLHPSRFRTRVCESGVLCPRKVCFFAHTPEQLRPEGAHHCLRCAQRAAPPMRPGSSGSARKREGEEVRGSTTNGAGGDNPAVLPFLRRAQRRPKKGRAAVWGLQERRWTRSTLIFLILGGLSIWLIGEGCMITCW
ncbi:zinc finger CCCH domain-containing protein 54-like [Asparagus officinalis]|uniref:zinc finger CCCH domain-containing protein 54-like n=1 Tax=Asparagus officinalis TaxID=4686 RepID=UPI00098E1C9D|nr:zinc finger CCCH domain-containing protein 54-like [Asparagus officinalis]